MPSRRTPAASEGGVAPLERPSARFAEGDASPTHGCSRPSMRLILAPRLEVVCPDERVEAGHRWRGERVCANCHPFADRGRVRWVCGHRTLTKSSHACGEESSPRDVSANRSANPDVGRHVAVEVPAAVACEKGAQSGHDGRPRLRLCDFARYNGSGNDNKNDARCGACQRQSGHERVARGHVRCEHGYASRSHVSGVAAAPSRTALRGRLPGVPSGCLSAIHVGSPLFMTLSHRKVVTSALPDVGRECSTCGLRRLRDARSDPETKRCDSRLHTSRAGQGKVLRHSARPAPSRLLRRSASSCAHSAASTPPSTSGGIAPGNAVRSASTGHRPQAPPAVPASTP